MDASGALAASVPLAFFEVVVAHGLASHQDNRVSPPQLSQQNHFGEAEACGISVHSLAYEEEGEEGGTGLSSSSAACAASSRDNRSLTSSLNAERLSALFRLHHSRTPG